MAGAWPMEKGRMYNKFAFNYFRSDETYDDDGNRHELPLDGEFRDLNINWYQEVGLTDRLTFLSSVYYKWLRNDNREVFEHSNGAGDFDLGIKANLLKKSFVLSVQGLIKVEGPYDSDETPGLGNDQSDFELRLLLGGSLHRIGMYYGMEGGYRRRLGDPSDEWRFLVELGGNFNERLYGRVKIDGLISAGNAHDESSAANITLTPEFDLIKLEATAGFRITRPWGLELTYTPTIYGKNTAAGYALTTALIFMF